MHPPEICSENHANSTKSYLFDKYAVKSMKIARVVLASKNPYFLRSRILANMSSDVPSSTAVKPSGPYFPVISNHISDCCDCPADRCDHGLDSCRSTASRSCALPKGAEISPYLGRTGMPYLIAKLQLDGVARDDSSTSAGL